MACDAGKSACDAMQQHPKLCTMLPSFDSETQEPCIAIMRARESSGKLMHVPAKAKRLIITSVPSCAPVSLPHGRLHVRQTCLPETMPQCSERLIALVGARQ